jgi:signal peptidase I
MTVSQAADAPAAKPEKSGAAHEFVEIVKTVLWALGIALVLRVLLFQPFTIPSASMEPALFEGDYIIVSKWSYGYSRHSIPFSPPLFDGRIAGRAPTRGDIVVFKLPRDDRTDYIKRVIGLPGDTVQVREGVLSINGRPVERRSLSPDIEESPYGPTLEVPRVQETLPEGKRFPTYDRQEGSEGDETDAYVVPAGHYFMMGDNRDNSIDSRWPEAAGVGMVPAENLVGKAELILLSWTPEASLFKPWTWITELRPSRFFTRLR